MNIRLHLDRKNAGDLVLFAKNISKNLAQNKAQFPNLPVSLTDFDAAINELETAHIATFGGGYANTQIRDNKRKVVTDHINKLGLYVSLVSNGDATIIFKAGMTPRSQRSLRSLDVATPIQLSAMSIVAGEVELKWNKINNARNYVVMLTQDPSATNWIQVGFSSFNKMKTKSLVKGTEYWFKVAAIGKEGSQSPWSNPVSVIVQ